GRDAGLVGDLGQVARRVDADHPEPGVGEHAQLGADVAAQLHDERVLGEVARGGDVHDVVHVAEDQVRVRGHVDVVPEQHLRVDHVAQRHQPAAPAYDH